MDLGDFLLRNHFGETAVNHFGAGDVTIASRPEVVSNSWTLEKWLADGLLRRCKIAGTCRARFFVWKFDVG